VTSEYLTTREVAELLRLKERKVYDMAAEQSIPCTRATGKLLFSRAAINRWLHQHSAGTTADNPVALISGSHDPLLEWAVRESQCGIATLFDGSVDGSERLKAGEATVAAIHIYDDSAQRWNIDYVAEHHAADNCVLVSLMKRQRGLVYSKGTHTDITALETLKVAVRQPGAGSQIVLESLLRKAQIDISKLNVALIARSEHDAVLAVAEGAADCTLGLEALAEQHHLKFQPLIEESLDLLVDRRFWFEPSMQKFISFCQSAVFKARLESMHGYRLADPFAVCLNL
jgi:excisionase family DNA binding protein